MKIIYDMEENVFIAALKQAVKNVRFGNIWHVGVDV